MRLGLVEPLGPPTPVFPVLFAPPPAGSLPGLLLPEVYVAGWKPSSGLALGRGAGHVRGWRDTSALGVSLSPLWTPALSYVLFK